MLLVSLLTLAPSFPPAAQDSLGKLVPKDTVILVQVPSLDGLVSGARRTIAAFDPSNKETIDAEHLLKNMDFPGDVSQVDPKRPLGLCLTLARDPGATPQPVFLVPARSSAAYVKSLTTPERTITSIAQGDYVLVAPESTSITCDGSAAALAQNLPAGDLVARVDLARLIEQFRPMIDPMLDQIEMMGEQAGAGAAGGINPAPVMGLYMDGVRDLLDSVQTLDAAVRLAGTRMEVGFDLANKPGSVLAGFGSKEKTDIRSLARMFDTNSAMNVLAGMDLVAMAKHFGPLYEALPEMYPDTMRPAMKSIFAQLDEFSAQMGSAMCVSADFAADGMRIAYLLRPKDAGKLLATYKSMIANMPGAMLELLPETSLDGVPVTSWRFRPDPKLLETLGATPEAEKQLPEMMKLLYGKEGMVVRIVPKGEFLALVMGGDDAFLRSTLARIGAGSAALPAPVQRALEQIGNMSPCFVMHYDLGKLMKGISGLVGSLEPGAAEEMPRVNFSVLAWGGVDGPLWHGALGADLDEITQAMREIEEQKQGRLRHVQAQMAVARIANALHEFAHNNGGKFPDSLQALVVKDSNGAAYLEGEHPLIDPWGREYVYSAPSAGQPEPRVSSLGRDGKPGGLGEDADVQSD